MNFNQVLMFEKILHVHVTYLISLLARMQAIIISTSATTRKYMSLSKTNRLIIYSARSLANNAPTHLKSS